MSESIVGLRLQMDGVAQVANGFEDHLELLVEFLFQFDELPLHVRLGRQTIVSESVRSSVRVARS